MNNNTDMNNADLQLIELARSTHPSDWHTINVLISRASSLECCRHLLRIRRYLMLLDEALHP